METSSVMIVVLLLFVDQAMAQADGGLSGLAIGLIVAGILILLLIAMVGICFFVYKRKHLGHHVFEHPEFERSRQLSYSPSPLPNDSAQEPIENNAENEPARMTPDRPAADSDAEAISTDSVVASPGKAERKERFEEQLVELQPHLDTLQEMLGDVDERVKTAKHGNPRVNGYKAVSRDLSRVQHLLSKRNSGMLKIPPDGPELLTWATECKDKYIELQRYKSNRDSGVSSDPPEMASIMWIQSKDDSAFEDKSYDESAVI